MTHETRTLGRGRIDRQLTEMVEQDSQDAAPSQLPYESHRFFKQWMRRPEVAPPNQQEATCAERLSSHRALRCLGRHGLQPLTAFAHGAIQVPDADERRGQPQPRFEPGGVERAPAQGRPKVVDLNFDALESSPVASPRQRLGRLPAPRAHTTADDGSVDRTRAPVVRRIGPPLLNDPYSPSPLPNGNILVVVDNGRHRGSPTNSRVIEIDAAAAQVVWSCEATPAAALFSSMISNAQRLWDGNTPINEGATGRLFEMTLEGELVWDHGRFRPVMANRGAGWQPPAVRRCQRNRSDCRCI